MHLSCPAPFISRGLGYPDHISFFWPRRDSIKTRHNQTSHNQKRPSLHHLVWCMSSIWATFSQGRNATRVSTNEVIDLLSIMQHPPCCQTQNDFDSKRCCHRALPLLHALRMIDRQHLLCRSLQPLILKPQQVARSSSARQTTRRNTPKPANGSVRTSIYRQSCDDAAGSAKPRPLTSAWALFSLKGKYGSGHETDFAEFHSAVLAQLRLEHSND